MHYQLLIIFCSYLIVGLILLQLRVTVIDSAFSNFIINSVLVTGIYAVYITGGKTVYLFPVCAIAFTLIFTKYGCFRFSLNDAVRNLFFLLFIFILFIALYYRNETVLFPAGENDYLYWVRLSAALEQYGKENSGVFYNVLNPDYPATEVYHYFELWTTNLGKFLNKQELTFNLFFFSYPLGTLLLSVGLYEWLNSSFKIDNSKVKILMTVFFLIGLFFSIHPWDFFVKELGIKNVLKSDIYPVWLYLKQVYPLIILVSIFLFIRKPDISKILTVILATFLYPPLLPLVLVVIFLWLSFLLLKYNEGGIKNFAILLLTGVYFLLFYKLSSTNTSNTISGFSLQIWLSLSTWHNLLPSVFMKVVVLPFIYVIPLVLISYNDIKKLFYSYKNVTFFIILYAVSIGVWLVYVLNVDANQIFYLLAGKVIVMLALYVILKKIINRNFSLAFILSLIFILPGFLQAARHQLFNTKLSKETVSFLKELKQESILYVPGDNEIISIYQLNERSNTGINSFIKVNNDLELMSLASIKEIDTLRFNITANATYKRLKDASPFLQLCGISNKSWDCIEKMIIENDIDYICIRSNNQQPVLRNYVKICVFTDFTFYKLVK